MTDQKTKLFQQLLTLVLVVAIALSSAACGRKGLPDSPIDSEFPRDYPSQ
jgi:predicted small lipoprotein YifL